MLTFIENNLWNIIFLLIGIAGLLFGYFSYRKSKKIKRVSYFQKSINLIKDNISDLKGLNITYKGTSIENLTLTNFALWNEGTETINKEDIALKNVLKIVAKGEIKILEYISYEKNKSNNFTFELNKEQNILFIDFDYFDKDEGIVLRIYHTGKSDNDLNIEGDFKGIKGLFKKNIDVYQFISRPIPFRILLFLNLFIFIPIILTLIFGKNEIVGITWLIAFVPIMADLMFFVDLIKPKKVPSGFDIIAKDFGYLLPVDNKKGGI